MSGFPGYTRLIGPEQLTIGDFFQVRTPGDYRTWQTVVVLTRNGVPWDSPMPAGPAHVNDGRWLATCHWCQKGMLTRPDWGVANCGECGARYQGAQVRFPENAAAIERVLCLRPRRDTQHWGNPTRPMQTIEDLERENREELQLC